MKANTLDIRPLSGAIGAEILGVDLARDVSDSTVAAIRAAWLEHCVVFFRGQTLDAGGIPACRKPLRRADRISVREGARRISADHARDQARAREDQFRRALALRHGLSRTPADGDDADRARNAAARRRHAVRQHVSRLRDALGGHEAHARRARHGEFLREGRCHAHARGPRQGQRQDGGEEGIRRRASGGAHASRRPAARRSTSMAGTRCASRT